MIGWISRWSGIVLILLVGLIHLISIGRHFEIAPYLGWLFVANVIGSLVVAVGIYRGAASWGWLLGALIAAASFVLFLISRTVGLPQASELVGNWGPLGIVSLVVEGLFVALYLSVTTLRR